MKKQSYRGLAVIALGATILTGCKLIGEVEYAIKENPVEMHGDSVSVTVTVKFPEKGLKKKASAEITPKLGDKSFKTITVQGEKATGNGQTIAYKPGATVNYTDIIPYSADLENADLMITGKVSKGKKEEAFEPKKIADGTIVTPLWVQNDDKALIGADNFVRTTEQTYNSQINYLKGKSDVRATELKDQDIKDLQTWFTATLTNPKIAPKKVNLVAYASPEGERADNTNLAQERATSGQEAAAKIIAASGYVASGTLFAQNPKGEDWSGFEAAVKASSLADKDLIIRVLQMNQDLDVREREIVAMSKTYVELEKDILPSLRRTQINVVYDKIGWSDEELKNLSKTKSDTLTIEELLFTATLYDDLNEKMRIYKIAAAKFPSDWRGHNNVGYVYYMQNDLANAKANFTKGNELKENPVTLNNLGMIARIQGDRSKATKLLTSAVSAGAAVKYNLGIIDIQNGDYAKAIGNFGGENTFNKALAQALNENYSAALTTSDASDDAQSAIGYYLKAIIGARQNNLDMVVNNLKSAVAKDPAIKSKAAKDREFISFFENASFKSAIN
jgi:Flp pilus assembly protein TadD